MNLKMTTPSEADARRSDLPSGKVSELGLKRIVCATDFSESSRKAFHYALSLAKHFHAEVSVLHVCEPPPPLISIVDGALSDTSLREDLAQQVEDWRRQVSSEVNAQAVLRDGTHPYKQIVAFAKEVDADLIIIGNHGHNRLARALVGSTAETVVRFAPCPVLVIREREHEFVWELERVAADDSVR